MRHRGLFDVPVQLCSIRGLRGFLLLCMGLMRNKVMCLCTSLNVVHWRDAQHTLCMSADVVHQICGHVEEGMGIMSGIVSSLVDSLSSAGSLVLPD